MVSKPTIEKIQTDVADYPDEALELEFDRFFRDQPEICDFVMDLTSTTGQRVREISLYLGYVVYKSLEATYGNALVEATPETIAAASVESQLWMERMHGSGPSDDPTLELQIEADEPVLLGFVVSEVEDAIADGLEMKEEEVGAVFFAMKTVIASLSPGNQAEDE